MHASSAERVGCPHRERAAPVPVCSLLGEKGFIDALVTVRCLLRACQRKERGKGPVQLMASARWALSLHAIAGRKVS